MKTTARRILATSAAVGVLSVGAAAPAQAIPDPGYPGGSGASSSSDSAPPAIREVLVDDDALEFLQIGLGLLAGMTLAGAAVVGVRRYRHHHHAPHSA